jgi:adenylate kinase family enzyme
MRAGRESDGLGWSPAKPSRPRCRDPNPGRLRVQCDTQAVRHAGKVSQMDRVSVVGNAGSGKSRLAAELASVLGTRHIELDAVIHQANWNDLEVDEFRRRVGCLVAADSWVIDGNYSTVRDLVWARADTVIWLDLPRLTVMTRVTRRTLGRVVTRRELWNGNRESWRDALSLAPYRSVVAWAWVQHRHYQRMYQAAALDPAWVDLHFVRVRSRRERAKLLSQAAQNSGGGKGGIRTLGRG